MSTVDLEGEKIIKKGSAKFQRGIEAVRGQLTLTERRLIFEPRQLNYQSELVIIKLSHILDMRKSWTWYLSRIPVFPSTLSVKTKNGKEYRFALLRRSHWMKRIHAQRFV